MVVLFVTRASVAYLMHAEILLLKVVCALLHARRFQAIELNELGELFEV